MPFLFRRMDLIFYDNYKQVRRHKEITKNSSVKYVLGETADFGVQHLVSGQRLERRNNFRDSFFVFEVGEAKLSY
jgi:hypothetical protein